MAILRVKQEDGTWAEIPAIVGEKGADGYTPQKGIDYFDGAPGADGSPGKDGTSVSVSSVSESTEDGGSNVVTFSDGKTMTVKNGSKGSQGVQGERGIQGVQGERGIQGIQGLQGEKGDKGDTGEPGYTPQKGTDYFDGAPGADGAKGDKGDTGEKGADGVSATHSWNGTVLSITSASGTSSADLKGDKGDKGEQGIQGIQGIQGEKGDKGDTGEVDYSRLNDYAKLASPNNMLHNGNEFTFIPDGYEGQVYINHRTASGQTNGNVSNYYFGNGKGGLATFIAAYFKGRFQGETARPIYNNEEAAMLSDVPTKTETWTFTLEDGSTVTKAVYVG